MTDTAVMNIAGQALYIIGKIAGPILAVTLIVGVVISFMQAITQIQETTLTFIPKLIAVGAVIFFAGHWMIGQLITFTDQLFAQIPQLLAS
ncbi:MAG: flagellar biosynthesis protein FliQ [Actinomycetota bacterium]|nr:flagellar biosynthesis protein FliQ [Actinomycetota bacterium]